LDNSKKIKTLNMDDSKKIKILHLHTLPVISGSGINTFLTMKLSNNIFESSMACRPKGKLEDLVKQNNFKFFPIKNFSGPISIKNDILSLIEIIKLLKKEKFDIIHTHNSKAGFLGRLAGFIFNKLNKNNRIKIVHTVHGFAFHNKEPFFKRNLFLILEKIAAYWLDWEIFISQPLIDWAKSQNLIKKKYTKVYSGIDTNNFQKSNKVDIIKKQLGINKNDFVIGEVAKLWDGKGHFTIIDTVNSLKDKISNLKVLFIGEGYLEHKLKEKIKELNLENFFIFTDFVENVNDYTSVLDIAMLISDFEGMGRVILEAMLCDVPVIATNVGGIVDLVKDNETGLLVEPNNPNMLKEKILLIFNDFKLKYKLISNAKKILNEKFTAKKMVEDINKIYLKVLENG